jgi:hypothetical protein
MSKSIYLIVRLASGATWQSSGQVLHIQNSVIETHFVKYSRQLYEKLHNKGHDIGKIRTKSRCLSREILSPCIACM